uniref:BPI2 domain-containing protein n=1 Tax=Wuchereria bancrofti TaxID=6293 RepID=A0AAF5PTV3_WUCBA
MHHHFAFVTIALWLANTADECLATPGEIFIPLQSALRVRFSDDIFHQLSRVVDHLFKKYVKQVIIPPQQQCFPEGCVKIQDFQLVAHQNPSYVGAVPTPPNLLTLRISGFNFYIVGTLYGHLQPLPLLSMTIPTYGTLAISANQLVVEATFDIQKTVDNVPYIRVVSCSLINEVILAWVENMGLFTIIVNTKYQHEITMKTRQILEETLCITVNNVVNNELNSQLLQIPNQISIFDLYQIFFENSDNISGQKMKRILGSESNYLQVPMQLKMQTTSAGIMLQESQLSRLFNTASYGHKLESIILNSSSTFPTNVALQKSKGISSSTNNSWENSRRKLSLLILSLSILDTSATYGKFFIGLDGDVYIKAHDQTINSYQRPKMLRFSEVINADAVDLLVSEYTINTLLLKAHIIGVFVFNVSSTTPVLGKLIRTSCGIDEVCLSDSIPEVAETYPNKQLEIIIRTTEPPKAIISADAAIVTLEGHATFFVEGTTEEIGLIPFSTTIQCNVISLPSRIAGLIKIRTLQFHEHIDFFGLTLQSLDSFKEAAKGAMMKMVNEIFREGISLNESATSRLSNTSISLVDRGILLQTKFNIERSFYQQMPISV